MRCAHSAVQVVTVLCFSISKGHVVTTPSKVLKHSAVTMLLYSEVYMCPESPFDKNRFVPHLQVNLHNLNL